MPVIAQTKHVCDLCGDEHVTESHKSVLESASVLVAKTTMFKGHDNTRQTVAEHKYWLCPGCTEDFETFMKGGHP